MIIRLHDKDCTDELTTVFYECPNCLFERVPFTSNRFHLLDDDELNIYTAQFCPGCGTPIEWV